MVTVIEHDAFNSDTSANPLARVKLKLQNGNKLVLIATPNNASTKLQIYDDPENHIIYSEKITDTTQIRNKINQISEELPRDVHRTAHRILTLAAWIDDQDWIEHKKEIQRRINDINVHGTYRALRPNARTLVLCNKGSQSYVVAIPRSDVSDEYITDAVGRVAAKRIQRRLLNTKDTWPNKMQPLRRDLREGNYAKYEPQDWERVPTLSHAALLARGEQPHTETESESKIQQASLTDF